MNVTRDEVERFLRETEFSNSQAVPLPYGLHTPGLNRSDDMDRLLGLVGPDLRGQSVLDVGTFYGLLPLEASRRGARRAVGLEPDPQRFAVAQRIARLHGGNYSIEQATAESYIDPEPFDVVFFLNVLHHVLNPVAAMQAVAALSRDRVIVEFCLADDPRYIEYLYSREGAPPGLLRRVQAEVQSAILRLVAHRIPLMAVGDRHYHRTFFFSREAFRNLFVVHHGLFSKVEFAPPTRRGRRVIAICSVS